MGRDNTKGKIQRTILHHLSWRGMAASLAMAALPATAAEPDSLAIDTMSYDLGDVTVTAQRKLVKNDIDKLTYDVANDETARTKNTLDMLRSVPLVTIDGQENISIKGSPSFKVYRNGTPTPPSPHKTSRTCSSRSLPHRSRRWRSSPTQAPKKMPRAHNISSTSSCRTTPTWQA